ncbi:MAG TPA: ABC transporter ATP-binding protein [Solirubrobacterales bacterium]|nr:ABC transporter ATP-binding protein [Solirubrobacterales bacterium]
MLLEGVGLTKRYGSNGNVTVALEDCDVGVERGETLVVVGPSGSGKSTLLHLLAGLDRPTSGSAHLAGRDLGAMSDAEAARFRAEHLGFVLQRANLVPSLTVRENVAAPLMLSGLGRRKALRRADAMLARVGLGPRAGAFPAQVSGGEAQRAAVARACVAEPLVVFADEPTGAVDRASGEVVMGLFAELAREGGTSAVIVTHDPGIADRGDTVVRMLDGRRVG